MTLPPWKPLPPQRIPDLRLEMIHAANTPLALNSLAQSLALGRATVLPVPPIGAPPGLDTPQRAAHALTTTETERLTNAHMYHVTADMCVLSNAVASTSPKGGFSSAVAPTPYGFVVFDEPIACFQQNLIGATSPNGHSRTKDEVDIDVPIVAASWGPLSAPAMIEHGPWGISSPDRPRYIPPRATGAWFTFYTPAEERYAALPPHKIVSYIDGEPVTAGQMAKSMRLVSGPLSWDNEIIVVDGEKFDPHAPDDSPHRWVRTVYAMWQMMRQEGHTKRTLTQTHTVHRSRPGARRDTRAHIDPDTSRVRVVDVHRRPSAAARAKDTAHTNGRRPTPWTHRWQVPPYWRNTCKNPHAHANGECEHEDQIIPWHIKGDPHLPLKPLNVVRQLSDTPPTRNQ